MQVFMHSRIHQSAASSALSSTDWLVLLPRDGIAVELRNEVLYRLHSLKIFGYMGVTRKTV